MYYYFALLVVSRAFRIHVRVTGERKMNNSSLIGGHRLKSD